MRIVKMVFILIAIHMGFGFTQFVVSYYQGDVVDYGEAGWVSHTPIGQYIDTDPNARNEAIGLNLSDIPGNWAYINRLGDMINGLASFNYQFLTQVQPEDGFVYQFVMAFRLVSVGFWITLAIVLLYILFDSGIINSKIGMSIMGLGLGLGFLSSVGALF